MQEDRYPWPVELEDQEWQCVYCGRFMDEPKAVRRAKEKHYKLDACVACHAIVGMARLETLQGRQERVAKVLNIQHSEVDGYRVYVNREGVGQLRRKKALRGTQQSPVFRPIGREATPPEELEDPYHGLLDNPPGPDPTPMWRRLLEKNEYLP